MYVDVFVQDKLGELQALVMQLMGEKNMLHSYAQESRRPVSPMFDPHAAQSQHMVNGKTDGRFEIIFILQNCLFQTMAEYLSRLITKCMGESFQD